MSRDGHDDEKIVRVEIEKHPTCLDCKLGCQSKGKDRGPNVGDLVNAPKECSYRMQFQETTEKLAASLKQHFAEMNRSLASVQAAKFGTLS